MTLELTPTQERFLNLLSDGEPHPRHEFHKLLSDSLSGMGAVREHISRLRAKLKPLRKTIACVVHHRRLCYQLFTAHDRAMRIDT